MSGGSDRLAGEPVIRRAAYCLPARARPPKRASALAPPRAPYPPFAVAPPCSLDQRPASDTPHISRASTAPLLQILPPAVDLPTRAMATAPTRLLSSEAPKAADIARADTDLTSLEEGRGPSALDEPLRMSSLRSTNGDSDRPGTSSDHGSARGGLGLGRRAAPNERGKGLVARAEELVSSPSRRRPGFLLPQEAYRARAPTCLPTPAVVRCFVYR